MAHVFAGDRGEFPLFVVVHGGLRRLDVVGCSRFHFDKTKHALVPGYQIDFPVAMRRAIVAGDADVSALAQEKVSVLFAAAADDLVRRSIRWGKNAASHTIKPADSGLREYAGKHEVRFREAKTQRLASQL